MTKQQLQATLKEQYIAAKTIDDLATKAMIYGLIK